jgi:amino acid transporter
MGYAMVPVAFGALRRQEPDLPRPFKLPGGEVLAPTAFIVANLIIYWSTWDVLKLLLMGIAIGFVFLALGWATNPEARQLSLDWKAGSWLFPYFAGMGVISFLGPTDFAGIGVIPFGWDVLVVAAFSLIIYFYAVSVRLSPEEVRGRVADARAEAEEEEEFAV